MFISEDENGKIRWRPALATLGCGIAAMIYHCFSRGVVSWTMALCFLPPLAFCLLDSLWLARRPGFSPWVRRWLGAAAATLAAAMFFQGVLEIAGSDSAFQRLFYGLGAGLAVVGALKAVFDSWRGEDEE